MNVEDHELLVEYYRQKEVARKERNAATLIEACRMLAQGVADAVLDRMGERVSPETSIADRLARVEELEPQRRHVFDMSRQTITPAITIPKLREAVVWLERADSTEYRGPLPPGSPYRNLSHISRALQNASFQLLASVLPPDEPKIELDWTAGFIVVEEEVKRDGDVTEIMAAVLRALEPLAPSEQWSWFEDLSYEEEVKRYRSFVARLAAESPPPFPIKGLWFGISHPIYEGRTTLDAYVAGADTYEPEDDDWAAGAEWNPPGQELRSAVLSDIYDLGYRRGNLRSGADLVGLAYVCLVAREATHELGKQLSDRIGVACGFDGGDPLHLGRF